MKGEDKTVCVTGASGFLACYIIKELLGRGYTVRGTVRDASDAKKTAHILQLAEGLPGRLTLHSADLSQEGSFDEAVSGCSFICHVASPVIMKVCAMAYLQSRNPEKEVVEPAISGTLNVLRSVQKAKTAKRVVVTSSRSAMVIGDPKGPGYTYTEADWNEIIDPSTAAYPTSKTLSERAAWEVYENQNRDGSCYSFDMVTILPGMCMGPVLHQQHLSTSPQIVLQLLDGSIPLAPDIELDLVDVRDVATAHVEALERPEAKGRYLMVAKNVTILEAANMLRSEYGKYKLPQRTAPRWLCHFLAYFHPQVDGNFMRRQLGVRTGVSCAKAEKELGVSFREVKSSLEDTAKSIVEQGFV